MTRIPTPAQLDLIKATAQHEVWQDHRWHSKPSFRTGQPAPDRRVTAAISTLEQNGWVKPGRFEGDLMRWWEPTTVGWALLDEHVPGWTDAQHAAHVEAASGAEQAEGRAG